MKTFFSPRSARRGFNLIELLVVIGIIAVLASLLFPALSAAKARAYKVKCISNLKQLSQTWALYSVDNKDKFAANGPGMHENPGDDSTYKTNLFWANGEPHMNQYAYTNKAFLIDPQFSLFANYIRTVDIYKCPADQTKISYNGDLQPRLRNYALNSHFGWLPTIGFIGSGLNNAGQRPAIFRKDADLDGLNPSQFFTFVDVAPASVCYPAFCTFIGSSGWLYHKPNYKHSSRGLFAFADGHVEDHKWVVDQTIMFAKYAKGPVSWNSPSDKDDTVVEYAPPPTGTDGAHQAFYFPTSNPDMEWLKTHASLYR
ncbi:MAG: hypothetical protein RL380_1846 [Verrucomicrobiota bacterium]|jgi:prepilin-type N-terminal cleavage/methylation domain-containing protein/prepilin-type processing-associated H-X9-DG protein